MLQGRFEALLHASEAALSLEFQRLPADPRRDTVEAAEAIAKLFSLNPTQLLCALAFNRHTRDVPRVWAVLAYSCFEALQSRANYLFINDCYRCLTIDNVLELYTEVVRQDDARAWLPDLVLDRLGFIEQQIEETINPVMIGSYKLEMRAIYTDGVATAGFAAARLRDGDAVLRVIANEVELMIEAGLVDPNALLLAENLSLDERRRLLGRGIVSPAAITARLGRADLSDAERSLLQSAAAPEK